MRKLVFSFFIALSATACPAAVGDTWDAKADWSDTLNPNGVWSYRSINTVLMVTDNGGVEDCGLSPSDWEDTISDCPNLFDQPWAPDGFHEPDEFEGHGAWIVRWTSPIDGYIAINGTVWEKFGNGRHVAYALRQNEEPAFDSGYVLLDGNGDPIIGPAGEVAFGPVYRQVNVHDTIDFIVDGSGPAGDGIATFSVASFWIEQVDQQDIPLPPANIDGDVNRDDTVTFADLVDLAAQWLNDCIGPRWCEGADIDESTDVDLVDFSYIAANWQTYLTQLHNLGYIVVSKNGPTDGGDFGNGTPGTLTNGLQEAFNYAVASSKDIYIVGGGASAYSGPVVYSINAPIYVPPAENLKVDMGDGVINFNYCSGDYLVFDSLKHCEFKFSLLVAPCITNGSTIMKIKPTTALSSGEITVANSRFEITANVGSGDVFGGTLGQGTALCLDASQGSIVNNYIYAREPIASDIGIIFEAGDIRNNYIECPFTHICNNLLVINSGTFNYFKGLLTPGGVTGSAFGANINGQNNVFDINFASGYNPASAVIFGLDARDNVIYAKGLSSSNITNNAAISTNRIVSINPISFNISTPPFPVSGQYLENRTSYTVVATIESTGNVTSWKFRDSDLNEITINAGLYRGQTIYLEPGDWIRFNYSSTPSWKWRALR